jgi:hypothetical protein
MAVRLRVEILRAGSEILPGDSGWVRRSRSMWTYDHYSELGGQFLDGSFGHFAKPQQDASNRFAGEEMGRVNSVRRGRYGALGGSAAVLNCSGCTDWKGPGRAENTANDDFDAC